MTSKPKIFIYLRVSTEDQTLENSRLKIFDYLINNHYDTSNVQIFKEKKSGYKYGYKERLIGTDIIPLMKEGDILIVNSLSRISRKLSDILHFVESVVIPNGLKVIIAKNNIILDNNPLNKLLISMLAMTAEFEIDILRERTKAGIARYRKENNNKWGRPKGQGRTKLDNEISEVKRLINEGVKYKIIAQKYGVCPNTLTNFIKRYNLKN
jgi:DNA invertase Pin-like site-specific DNA recombinase